VLAYPDLDRLAGVAPRTVGGSRSRPITNIGHGVRFGVANRVLTAASVVTFADSIEIQVGRRRIPAELLGVDPISQLALLSVNDLLISNEPPPTSEIPAAPGDVISMVDMLGDLPTLHTGYVTDLHPSGRIITSLPVYPGLSGAPLINERGEVVGVMAFTSSERSNKTGAGDAIGVPADLVAHIASELEQYGTVRRGYFGAAHEEEITNQIVLTDVLPDGPAGLAGLRSGDTVVQYGGDPVRDPGRLRELVLATVPGTAVPVQAIRDSVQITLTVIIGDATAALAEEDVVMGMPGVEADLMALAQWRALIEEIEALFTHPEFDPGRSDVRTRLARLEREVMELKKVSQPPPESWPD
jgi:S1-C subfamily serine protease